MDLVKCSRSMDGDLSELAAIISIGDEEAAAIQSRFKKPQSQALQLLRKWHSQTQGSRQALVEVLKSAAFHQAAQS